MEEIQENSRIIWAVSITAYIQTGIYHLRLVSIQKVGPTASIFVWVHHQENQQI